jgi:RNA polymerase sigma-70 factor (ECF subfamily)
MATSECIHLASSTLKARLSSPIPGAAAARRRTNGALRPAAQPRAGAGSLADEQQGTVRGSTADTIPRAQLGDELAWEALVRQNIGWIFAICCRWVGSGARAEDLTQDVFIKVFQNLHTYKGEITAFRTWLGRLTRNLLIDDYRKNRRERYTLSYDHADNDLRSILDSIPSSDSTPEANAENRERKAALRALFRLIGPELREAVILRDQHGFSYEEISGVLKMPVGTVKSRINRGRIELVRIMRQRPDLRPSFAPRHSAVA